MNRGVLVILTNEDRTLKIEEYNLKPSEQIAVTCSSFVKICRNNDLTDKTIKSILASELKGD